MMKYWFSAAAFIVAMVLGVSNAQAEGPWSAQVEALFLKAYTGMGSINNDVTDLEIAPRVTLGRQIGENNLGMRFTYFDWDDRGTDATNGLQRYDIKNWDMELFKRLNLSTLTSLELSTGIRYAHSDCNFGIFGLHDFYGVGGVIGGKLNFQVGQNGQLYSKAKFAILGGNGRDATFGNSEVLRNHTEIGMGYQQTLCIRGFQVTPVSGVEWMNFEGYGPSTAFDSSTDLGLIGFVTGLSVRF
jgi:hypothetical protein